MKVTNSQSVCVDCGLSSISIGDDQPRCQCEFCMLCSRPIKWNGEKWIHVESKTAVWIWSNPTAIVNCVDAQA